jgi:putative lipoic acid-binding regulatory protein
MEGIQRPKMEFPMNIDLKIIMEMKNKPGENAEPPLILEENRKTIVCVLSGLSIPHFEWRTRFSAERNYVSFSVNVTLENQEKMDRLYEEMKKIPSIRFAV